VEVKIKAIKNTKYGAKTIFGVFVGMRFRALLSKRETI